MSEESKRLRGLARDKARRLAGGTDPHQKVDASSWEPPEPLNTTAKTGERPISRQARKRGGVVEGESARHHAGRKARKAGGRNPIGDAIVNRDVKEANEERAGVKHDGGFKRGGSAGRERAHRLMGGPLAAPLAAGIGGQGRMNFAYPPARSPAQSLGLKKGGKVGKAGHADEAQDRALVKRMVERPALTGRKRGGRPDGRDPACGGGMMRAAGGRSVSDGDLEGARPEKGGRFAKADGGRLASKERRRLPKSDFGEPGKRAYPMPDKSHAANAKARASQMAKAGKLSEAARSKIDAKADRVLARAHGGRTRGGKGRMNVNVIVAPQHGAPPMAAPPTFPPPGGMPPPRAAPVPVPTAPMGMAAPGGLPAGMPMGAAPGAMPPGALPPGLMRKRGGRAYDAGAGGGLGRLEKIERYGAE